MIETVPGVELLGIFPDVESAPEDEVPLTFTQVVVMRENNILLLYNPERKQWELPGGGLEMGETIQACAIREVYEETSQQIENPTYRGLFKIRLRNGSCEYGALYVAHLAHLQPHLPNAESAKIIFWDRVVALDDRLSLLAFNLLNHLFAAC